jgi:hypothetical protein
MASIYAHTSKLSASFGVGGGYGPVKLAGAAPAGNAMANAKAVWHSPGGAGYTMTYSTIDFSRTASSVSNTGSGASASGRTYTPNDQFGVAVVGTWSGTGHWHWEYVSGDGSIVVEDSGNPGSRFFRDIAGVANGTTSSTYSAVWRLWVYDDVAGASAYDDFTINVAWQNTIPAYTQISLSGPTSAGDECHVGLAPGNCTATAGATLTLSGGPSSPSYTWSYVSGDNTVSTAGQGTLSFSVGKNFHVNNAGSGPSVTSTWRCTAHDGIGSDATHDVEFFLSSFGDND